MAVAAETSGADCQTPYLRNLGRTMCPGRRTEASGEGRSQNYETKYSVDRAVAVMGSGGEGAREERAESTRVLTCLRAWEY
jgi:hypothetical protein